MWLRRRFRALLLIGLVAVILTGCRVDAVVEIEVADDGSGVVNVGVSLDEEALAAVPDLAEQLQVDDLRDAGWVVSGPSVEADGLTWVRASKPFEEAARLGPVIEEVTGPDGVLRMFNLDRTRSFAETTFELTGIADLSGSGLESFGDDDLAVLLDGEPLGRSLAELEADAGEPLADTAQLTVIARFPDDVGATTGQARGSEVRWVMRLDDPAATPISTRVTAADLMPRIWAAVAIGALVALVALVLLRWLRRRRELRAPIPLPERPDPKAREEIQEQAKPEPKRRRVLEQVAIDANGCLFRVADDDGRWLMRFVRDLGVPTDLDNVRELLRQASLGRLSSRELWAAIGVDGDADELDAAYLEPFELTPGARELLERLARRGLSVACVTNDVLAWSQRLRHRYDLDPYIDTWIVSSEVGCRKPDPAMFEALKRKSGIPLTNSLFIDDRAVNLDAARQVGMSTAWFTGTPTARPSGGDPHREVMSFDELFPEQARARDVEPEPADPEVPDPTPEP